MSLRCFSKRSFLGWLHALALLVLAFTTAACGEGAAPLDGGPPDAGPASCGPEELPLDGDCQAIGLPPDMQCPPGEMPLEDGGCQPAGVPQGACAQGFETDGKGGCTAILPAAPCPDGTGLMAIPGDTECRPVAPCGSGTWGDIPIEADTQFVNGDYAGGDSDGTKEKPWTHIQDGVKKAAPGGIVAVAEGLYVEDVLIQAKRVEVWGKCPEKVTVMGTGVPPATIVVLSKGASKSGIHTLAIMGPKIGVGTTGASDVVVDRVWIHDTMGRGIDVNRQLGKSSIQVSASLIETTKDVGVNVEGSDATITATVVRDTKPLGNGTFGHGIFARGTFVQGAPARARLTLRASLVEQNREVGVYVTGSDATIESTVVRRTQPNSKGEIGRGIVIEHEALTKERSTATLRSSLVEENHEYGVFVGGSDVTIEETIVRATEERDDGTRGDGIAITGSLTGHERSKMVLRSSLVDQNHRTGVHVEDSDATIEATIVRNTQPNSDGTFGHGIEIADHKKMDERTKLTLRSSLVEQNHDIGVIVAGSDAAIEATVVRGTQPRSDGDGGRGIDIQEGPDTNARGALTLRASLVEQNHEFGVFISGSDATIEATVVRETLPRSDGTGGRGIEIQISITSKAPADVTLRASLVEQNREVGVLVAGSKATIEATIVRGTQSISDGTGGRGIGIQYESGRSNVKLLASLVDENHEDGVLIFSSDVTIADTVVRSTQPNGDGMFGDGIAVTLIGDPSIVDITSSRSEGNARVGIYYYDCSGTLSDVVSTGNQYGLLLQAERKPDYESGHNQFSGNIEKETVLGGDFVVSEGASSVPPS